MGKPDSRIQGIIALLKARLQHAFGERFTRLIIFGSYARGDADKESDIDVLVVLSRLNDRPSDESACFDIAYELAYENDIVISAIPVAVSDLDRATPLFLNIKKEGVPA